MIQLSYDLHIHSCLSPCGDDTMTPANIAGMAFVKGLDVVALTDHNTCRNCVPFIKHCNDYGILAIPGMEVTTMEEVHVLCLFGDIHNALKFDDYIYSHLLKTPNNESLFGNQMIYDEQDVPIAREKYLLINAVNISFDNLYDIVNGFSGIMIPAHIDKEVNSLIANLGFVSEENKFKCFEINNKELEKKYKADNRYLNTCKTIYNSDAHFLHLINEPENTIEVEEKTVSAVIKALC